METLAKILFALVALQVEIMNEWYGHNGLDSLVLADVRIRPWGYSAESHAAGTSGM
jgi:hypothetical protein